MDKHRLVMVGVGLAILVVIGLGFLVGVQPQLSASSDAAAQALSIEQSNQATQAQLAQLQRDHGKLDEFKAQLATLQQSIPTTESLDVLLGDLHALAASTGTTVSAFTPAQPVPYTPPVAPVTPAAPSTGSSGSSSSSTATPAPAPAAPVAPVAPRPATNPLITPQNFAAVPISMSVTGSTDAALAFLGGLQHGSRLFLVTGFSGGDQGAGTSGVAKAAAPATPTYSITGFVYVLQPAKGTATAAK